jgi:hypothetical protein
VPAAPSSPERPRDARAVAVYTLARAGLLGGCLLAGWLVGLSGPLLLVVALLTSGALSLFLLQRQRLAMSATVERSLTRMRARAHARTAAEDAYVDAMAADRAKDRTG